MKVKLDIGINLRYVLENLIECCVVGECDPGIAIQQAFGIDFSKSISDDPELRRNLELTVEKKES